ncbi:MAG TPA: carbohydrate ABC transporter permease [Candidatus Limnocylindrales bacterium]|nr:carbohydrate ABC transporter permease [Candidatus Limnocylindrales bacterium]
MTGRVSASGVRIRRDAPRVTWLQLVGGYLVLGTFAAVALLPILTIWLTGFKTNADLVESFFGLPRAWHWENVAAAWDRGRFGTFLANSLIVVVPVVLGALVLSTLAGYGLARWRFRGQQLVLFVLLLGLMAPMEAVIIPLYYDMRAIGLLNTYAALILPQVGLSVAFGSWWMRAFFLSAPGELLDAAAVDGAGPVAALRHVLLPLARPALLTLGVLVFTWTWNEFLLALVLVSDDAVRTLPVGLAFFVGQYSADVPLLAMGATIVSLPIVLVFLVFQGSLIRGIVGGAVRG